MAHLYIKTQVILQYVAEGSGNQTVLQKVQPAQTSVAIKCNKYCSIWNDVNEAQVLYFYCPIKLQAFQHGVYFIEVKVVSIFRIKQSDKLLEIK